MTTHVLLGGAAAISTDSAWRRFSHASPALAWAGAAFLATSVLLLLPMAIDARQWQGVSTWLKPWKFNVSLAIQMLTFALFAHALAPEARRRTGTRVWMGLAIAIAVAESAYITAMAGLNLGSHFNKATPTLAVAYAVMGVGAVLLSMSGAALGIQIARFPRPGLSPVLRWGLALALVLGWLLGTTTGAAMSSHVNHWVGGIASDAVGLPLLGWSRLGGDLRPPHFIGVHATQAVALAAWWLHRRARPPGDVRRALLGTAIFATLWSLLALALFAQAMAGRPLWAA